jgi:hypothetical protein
MEIDPLKMEVKRRSERNRITNEIRINRKYNQCDYDSIERLRHSTTNLDYVIIQIEKLKSKLSEREELIKEMESELLNLDAGMLDDEINLKIINNSKESTRKNDETERKKKLIREEKIKNKKMSSEHWEKTKQIRRENRFSEKDMLKSYGHFYNACSSIPEYMLKKLSNMPSNKGFIWKSVYCYGAKKEERNKPTVMFENKKGGIFVIHEWFRGEYKRFEKKGEGKKELKEHKYTKVVNNKKRNNFDKFLVNN